MLFFAADRFSGEPAADCNIRVIFKKKTIAEGRTNGDGLFEARLPDERMEDVIGVAQCGGQVAATDPGSWTLGQPARELAAYIYTDKPIYRPGHTVHLKGILRWRQMDTLAKFDRPDAEVVVSDANDKVVFRRQVKLDGFGAVHASFPVPATAALGNYTIRIQSGDRARDIGGFEVQEYRKPEFEVIVTPASRFVVQGREAVVDVQARYYFGQPVANGQLRWVVNQQPYFSPLRWNDDVEGGDSSYWYGDNQTAEGTLRLDETARRRSGSRSASTRTAATSARASRRRSPMPRTARYRAARSCTRLTARSSCLREAGNTIHRGGEQVQVSIRALDYLGDGTAECAGHAVARASAISIGLLRAARSHSDRDTERDDRCQLAGALVTFTLPNRTGSFRIRATAPSADRTVQDDVFLWVPGPADYTGDTSDRYLELLADKTQLSARRIRDADRARRNRRLVPCSSQRKASTCRGSDCCGRRRRIRSRCRSTKATSAMSS